ncbi:NIPSNAP family protein (plasmid) [Streptomycetaceae bacterium NBC_01309]
MITCHLRYEIDPTQAQVFEVYACGWIPVIEALGGTHHGYFLPHEGADDVAYALFSFPNLAAYEKYHAEIIFNSAAVQLLELAAMTGIIRRCDHTFLRPLLGASVARDLDRGPMRLTSP